MKNKNYIPLSEESVNNKSAASIPSLNVKNTIFETTNSIEKSIKSYLVRLRAKSLDEEKKYLINKEDFKIWHNSKIKCVSYNGVDYVSLYKPKNDLENIYILINKNNGNFIYDNFFTTKINYEELIYKLNNIINKGNEIQNLLKNIKIMLFFLYFCIILLSIFMSMYGFYSFYMFLFKILNPKKNHIKSNNKILFIIFALNLILFIIVIISIKKVKESKYEGIFKHLFLIKNKLLAELNEWNEKVFSTVNQKAFLIDNFEYINIKSF